MTDTDRIDLTGIGRRGFIGAGLAGTAAALIAPASAGARAGGGRSAAGPNERTADEQPPAGEAPPDEATLVPIPPGRVPAAVDALDGLIADVRSRTGVPGIAAAVIHDGRLLYAKGFGVRDIRTKEPVNEHTVFHLASVSKPLSATVVAGLVGHKHADWHDPVVKHLPSFALSDPYVTKHVTIADMFSHRSGLPDHAGDLLEDLGYDQEYILHALRLEPLKALRVEWMYTNFGLTAAAVAAATAAGKSWPDAADEQLFGPLGMGSSSFRNADFLRQRNRAAMHVRIDGRWEQKFSRDADPEAPAGGATSNVLDMARWLDLILANGNWSGKPLIDGDALAESHLPWIISGHPSGPAARASFYGYGTNVGYDYSGRLRLTHSGAFAQGAATAYSALPSERLGIIVLTNGMPIGVPETIGLDFLDLVIAGSIQADWLKLLTPVFDRMYVNHSKLAGKNPPTNPTPAKPDRYYTGKYHNDYYGPIEIVAKGSRLQLLIGPRHDRNDYPLEHWDGNEFSFFPTGENALGITAATFGAGDAGRAGKVTLEYYDANHLGVFERA